ncbi:MAG: hypothetical protein M3198_11745 [Actinomycetota bacterium]|nr:hypothetical protein [Actinomycetota bacterium]
MAIRRRSEKGATVPFIYGDRIWIGQNFCSCFTRIGVEASSRTQPRGPSTCSHVIIDRSVASKMVVFDPTVANGVPESSVEWHIKR